MKVEAKFITNHQDRESQMEANKDMALDDIMIGVPDPEYIWSELCINASFCGYAYKDPMNPEEVIVSLVGDQWRIRNSDGLVDTLNKMMDESSKDI